MSLPCRLRPPARTAGVVRGCAHCRLPGSRGRDDGIDVDRSVAPVGTLVVSLASPVHGPTSPWRRASNRSGRALVSAQCIGLPRSDPERHRENRGDLWSRRSSSLRRAAGSRACAPPDSRAEPAKPSASPSITASTTAVRQCGRHQTRSSTVVPAPREAGQPVRRPRHARRGDSGRTARSRISSPVRIGRGDAGEGGCGVGLAVARRARSCRTPSTYARHRDCGGGHDGRCPGRPGPTGT